MEQFLRTRLILGEDSFRKLAGAKVTVIGLGAVGSYATEALARAGVGALRLVDFDVIKLTNLNRQLFALHSTLGKTKAEVARARVLDINPACAVETCESFATLDTLATLLGNGPDLVIDAIDALNPKIQLLHYCRTHAIPVISSMGAALRTDPSAIRSGDLFKSYGCPLANRVRKFLRKRGVTDGIYCVFSPERPAAKGMEAEALGEGNLFVRGRKRLVLGSLPTLTGLFGLTVAHCAIGHLTGKLDITFTRKKSKTAPLEQEEAS